MNRREQLGSIGLTAIAARLGLLGLLVALVLVIVLAQPPQTAALAPLAITYDYGWENGGTLLGCYGNVGAASNVVSGTDPSTSTIVMPHGGSAMLQMTESPLGGTPQGYIAYVENLVEGDQVTASFWGWDSTPGASPSLRIWGHWAESGNVNSYEGSAGGSGTYTDGHGWFQLSNTWTLDATVYPTATALVIEARLYSSVDNTDYWVDDVEVIAPDSATVSFPPGSTAVTLAAMNASSGGLPAMAIPVGLAAVLVGSGYVVLRRRRRE